MILFIVYRESLENNSNLEYMNINMIGVHAHYVHMHANLVTPYGRVQSTTWGYWKIFKD